MNGMINSNTENNERGLLPHPIILAANKGEAAMKVVVLHYGSYMTSLSMRKLRDEQGILIGASTKIHVIAYVRSLCKEF